MRCRRSSTVPAETQPPADREQECDVLVVGAGLAGLSAAIAAAEAGATVVILEERRASGGQFAKPLAASHTDTAPDAQFRLGSGLRARAEQAGVRLETDAVVWGAFAHDEIAAIVRGEAVTWRPRSVILATGAHEAPVPVPGWTLPGVMTTGGQQTLVRTQRVSPGERVLIAGNGPLNLQLACELLAGGIKPVAVLEAAPRPGISAWRDLARMARAAPDLVRDGAAMLLRLKRAGVPVLWSTRLERLEGDDRVSAAVAGTQRFDVDTVALNMGFQSELNLARALGVAHRFEGRGAGTLASETDPEGRTRVSGVFSVGDGAILGGARIAAARGRLAGLAAARDLGFPAPADQATVGALARAEAFQQALCRVYAAAPMVIVDEAIVCRCEEVTASRLRSEIAAGLISLPALKKATRAGMGRCQGRFCAATIARLCPAGAEPEGFAAPRAPIRPVPAAALMREAAEFTAPLLADPPPPLHLHAVLAPLPIENRRAGVVVIGGGAVGLSAAYYLAAGGADVLLLDRDEAAMAASTANAGSLHVQLLPYDFTDDTPADGGPAAHTLPLGRRGIALWKTIGAAVNEDLGIRTEGGLMLAEDEAGLDWLRRKSSMERRWGIETHVLGRDELAEVAPALSDRMLGAGFAPAEGYGDPLRGMMALLRLAQANGVRLVRGMEVRAIERSGAGWTVMTDKGAGHGGQSGERDRPLGGKPRPDGGAGAAGDRHRAAGHRDRASPDADPPSGGDCEPTFVAQAAGERRVPDWRRLVRRISLRLTGRSYNLRRNIEGNLWVCGKALPALRALSIVRAWTGINTVVDRAPLLGEVPGMAGFYNAVTANGYTLGPVVGQITAEAILHGEAIDPHYRIEQFG